MAPFLVGMVAAGATLLAVVVTSLFNIMIAKINIEAQSRQKNKEKRLEKLEELFFLFDKWRLNFSSIYLHHLCCYKGNLTYNQVMELSKELRLLAPGEAQKYRMVMELYFPSLIQEYVSVEAARKHLVPFLSDPQISKLSVQEFESYQVAFEEACETFKSKISALAHETLG